MHSWATL